MTGVRDFGRTVTFVLLLWVWSALPAAAQAVGAIGGSVLDPSGAVLPGVTVTLSSSQGATVGANQQSLTDERGAYQFLRLVPGTYIVRAELQGFRPAEQRDISVVADATARVDLRLEIGTLAEGVTVTGDAPLLDTTSALTQTVLSHDVLSVQPNRYDVWSIAKGVPGVNLAQVDVGGSAAFTASTPTVHGSSIEGGIFLDGMDVSQVDGNGNSAIFFLDPSSFVEANYQMGGAGNAATDRGGLLFNMITRTGTNQWHGEYNESASIPGLGISASNFSPALEAQLLATVPAVALAANPGLVPGNRIIKNYDYGGWLSGPVVKDKLWFSFAAHDKVLNQYDAGNYNPNGTQVLDANTLWFTSGKMSWQMTKSAQLQYTNNLQHRELPFRMTAAGGSYAATAARDVNDKYPDAHMLKYTSTIGTNMVVDVMYNRFRVTDRFRPEPGVGLGTIAAEESTTAAFNFADPSYRQNGEYRDQLQGGVTFIAGRNELKAGYQFVKAGIKSSAFSTSGMLLITTSGVPTNVRTYNVPIADSYNGLPERFEMWDRTNAVYLQDKWTPFKKLVINAGLRFTTDYGWEPATTQAATPFVAAQSFPALNGVPDYHKLVPRFSAVYDVTGDGTTALKFAANQYEQPTALLTIMRVNPVITASDTRAWSLACAPGQTSACDLNGDGIPEANELGPSTGFPAGTNNQYAPGLRPPMSNEYSAELEHQLPGNMVVTAGYTYRETRDNVGVRNVLVPASSYVPLTVTEATSGQTVTVYNQAPSTKGQILNVWSNSSLEDSNFHGGDITINKRMSHHWSLLGGASYGRTTGDTLYVFNSSTSGDLNNPNSQQYRYGEIGNDVPWAYKASGVLQLPYAISASATTVYQAGLPDLTTVTVNSATVALTQGTQVVTVAPRGTTRTPNVFDMDLSVQKPMKFRQIRLAPRIDFYNLTNAAAVLTRVTTLGPAYLRPSTIEHGRVIKFGGTITF